MTTYTETEYMDWLEGVLCDEYGDENVQRNPRLETDRIPDFLIDTWLCTLAVEVEDREEDMIDGSGQASMYAAHDTEYVPVVVGPPDGTATEELDLLHGDVGVVLRTPPDDLGDE